MSIKYLKSVGFKSSNDTYLIRVFKAIGFLDAQGVPTEVWTAYRATKRGGAVLSGAIKRGYSELFVSASAWSSLLGVATTDRRVLTVDFISFLKNRRG